MANHSHSKVHKKEAQKRYIEGYFLQRGMALGIPLGAGLGIALGNISIGIAIGVALGAGIGSIIEKKQNPNPIKPSKQLEKKMKIAYFISFLVGAILLGIVAFLYFSNK